MLNRVTQIGENVTMSRMGLLASYTYDDHGRRHVSVPFGPPVGDWC
jgi:hypothetical protein